MIFYEKETLLGLVIASLPAIVSAYFFYVKDKKELGLLLLLTSAFLLRILMISVDPYVHEWDERYHALVAKNMIHFPFRPMLFVHPVFNYDIKDWSYNHIWLHKQPLFLWQMAFSMKIFGVNTIGLRIPSAIMGTVMVWLVYDTGLQWIRNNKIAFLAAFQTAFAYKILELTSGLESLDHNDLTFTFYVTCSFWAFGRYINSNFHLKWSILIGFFAGMAVLNKWLTGLLIFGGWGLYLVISPYRFDVKKYGHWILALAFACLVFLPWQFYILHLFPVESAIEFDYNRRHITDDMGHPGNAFTQFAYMGNAYHLVQLVFLVVGAVWIFFSRVIDRRMTFSFMAMLIVLLSFFSFFVAVKMPGYTYPVSSLLMILIAYGMYNTARVSFNWFKLSDTLRNILLCMITITAGFLALKPCMIVHHRAESNKERNAKIHNAAIFKRQDDQIMQDHIILNCKTYENIELMFYKNTTAYHFWHSENVLDSVQSLGYKFAAFQFAQQLLPDYITCDENIIILQEKETFK